MVLIFLPVPSTGYRDTTNALGTTNEAENNDVTRICSVRKMIYFSHIPNLLGWLFCIAAGKRYCLFTDDYDDYIVVTLELPLMHFFEPQVVSINL